MSVNEEGSVDAAGEGETVLPAVGVSHAPYVYASYDVVVAAEHCDNFRITRIPGLNLSGGIFSLVGIYLFKKCGACFGVAHGLPHVASAEYALDVGALLYGGKYAHIKLGDADESYSNPNLRTLTFGNNTLLNIKWVTLLKDKGTCGDNVSWKLDTNGVLTISGSGAMTAYSSQSPAPWSSYKDSITSFVIEEGVTEIKTYAFQSCCKLKNITLPKSLLKLDKGVYI